MSYDTFEDSVDSSIPVELYEFIVYNNTIRYTSADRDITFESHIYVHHEGLMRSAIEDNGRVDESYIEITARDDFEISALYDPYPPEEPVALKIRRLQFSENDARTVWIGRVASASWPEISASQLRCEHYMTAFNRPGLRRKVQKTCNHVLYGPDCRADPVPHTQIITVDSVAGRRITSAALDALPDGWANGGVMLWEYPTGRLNKRGLWNHVGNALDLTYPLPILTPGTAIAIRRGCNHVYKIEADKVTESGDCKTVFDNTANYGGFQNFTGINIFDSNQPITV